MPFLIIRDDILHVQSDCIVNSANHYPQVGYGVDSMIYEKAGAELLAARHAIGTIEYGDVVITPGYQLNTKYIFHTVSPSWKDGKHDEIELLKNCYEKSFILAVKYHCQSITLPLLGSGHNQFPKEIALQCAIDVIKKFLSEQDLMVYLVVYDSDSFDIAKSYKKDIQTFIDDHYIAKKKTSYKKSKTAGSRNLNDCIYESVCDADSEIDLYYPDQVNDSLQEKYIYELDKNTPFSQLFEHLEDTFSESLIKIIDSKGLNDPDVYKKANIDRKLFSKIKNNPQYKPSKSTALAFAIALKLNLEETKSFIAKAGYALSHSSKFDIIIEYFISNQIYDIFEINEVLFYFDQPLIGG